MSAEKGQIKWSKNTLPKSDVWGCVEFLNEDSAEIAFSFHRNFPQYSPTPLVRLENLAKNLGVGGLYVKDESFRFGLNAFKSLGGSYSMGNYIAKKLGMSPSELTYAGITSHETREKLGDVTFFTATDGNHGRGVAWAARALKQKSVVLMPKGSSETRFRNIIAEGADAFITELNYDDAVRLANEEASKVPNGVIVQDTAWEGYTDIPAWIMQGYTTMTIEARNQLEEFGVNRPTHVFVQAGVGSLAGAVEGYFANVYKDAPPKVVVVESDLADCFYQSALANDGNARAVGGEMQTLMAGLACGEANIIGWEILKNHAHCFVSCPDWVAAKGMRILGNPLRGDAKVISGESGAVTTGLLYEIMTNPGLIQLKEHLGLSDMSEVLVFSTEGDTDPDKYLDVVWNGSNEK